MKDLVTFLLKSIVSHPESVKIHESDNDTLTSYDITVDPQDMGEVIGRGGRIIKSLRSIVKAASLKQGKRVHINLVENEKTPTV